MPQESPTNENNTKSKPRFGGRRRDYVDTFRWGFVPEEDAAHAVPNPNAEKKETKKAGSSLPESPDSTPAPLPKPVRQRKKAAKTKATKTKSATAMQSAAQPAVQPEAKQSVEKMPTAAPKAVKKVTDKQSSPEKRQAKGRKRTKKASNPRVTINSYTANAYDENDEDLKLPSYGRTPVPKDNELPVPRKIVRQKTVREAPNPPTPPSPTPPATASPASISPTSTSPKSTTTLSSSSRSTASSPAVPVSEVTSCGFRPRKEQMVWDPDKREYVPLVINESQNRENQSRNRKAANRAAQPEARAEIEADKSADKTTKKERPPKPPVKKAAPTAAVQEPAPQQEEKPGKQHKRYKEKRGDVPKFDTSPVPDPTDVESEVSAKLSLWTELGVSDAMIEALKIVRYLEPTPIQAGVFQMVRAGTDLMGQAQTGTGKTAAFSMPIIEGVETCPPGNDPVAIILVPTRELAVQVRDEAMRLAYGRDIRITACYGGKPIGKQIERLKAGIDILVGTPGRILDLINRRALSLDAIRWVVLDEADRMLDVGFRPAIEKILRRTPQERQTLLFSATLPPPVVRLAEKYMKSPEVLDFSNKSVAVETIEQFYVTVDSERKFDALVYLLEEQQPQQAIIFTRTKRGADRLARLLDKRFDKLAAIHGDMQQGDRDRVMAQVRSGKIKYLVATDVVGRGIDVSSVSHIINYDIPKFCDDYVHRVGRTGRMGRDGVAFTFVTVQEGSELTRIEMRIDKLLKRAELKGFESFTKPHDPNASLEDDSPPEPPKPVFGKPVRKVRRAL